jgi:hypothetical protein
VPLLDPRGSARVLWLGLALAACSDARERTGRAPSSDASQPGWSVIEVIDFNGDGLGDAYWGNPDTGQIEISLLRGTDLIDLAPPIHGPEGAGWAAISGGGFDVDGIADVVWFSRAAKSAAVWLLSGTKVASRGIDLPAPPGDGWVVAYSGDFDGDGLDDLLWHDTARSRSLVWLMNGTSPKSTGPELAGPSGAGWVDPSTGDFNLDGMTDVLWYDTESHRIAVWLMAGEEILERGLELPEPPDGDWTAITAADFDADGLADVIWNDAAANRFVVWLMDGTHVREVGPVIPGPAGESWSVGSAGDTDGDGMADVLWQNLRTHRQMVWTMCGGTQVLTRGPELPAPE